MGRTQRQVWQAPERVAGPSEPTGQEVESGGSVTTQGPTGGYRLIELPEGATVRRYTILRRVGAGAMGVVYEAHDPSLDRNIAIKILRKRPIDPNESAVGQARLLREARALARLSHPNVVPVYDVGMTELGGHTFIFIAMEFVEGKTLRTWLAQEPQRPAKVLEVMRQAGRGLAAAHAAGLVHRDFKLDNVIIDETGRVRVMDFGLARPLAELDEEHDSSTEVDSVTHLGTTLTEQGTVMGTPVYMSPEQHVGKALDARSDQFAFCVALYEALYGRRPFVGPNTRRLARAKIRGRIRRPPKGHPMIALFETIERGLQPKPEARWPAMGPLLRRLGYRRRSPALAAALIGAAVTAVTFGTIAYVRVPSPCDHPKSHIEEVWNGDRRANVDDRLRAAESKAASQHLSDTVDLTLARIDTYTEAWASAWEMTCHAGVEAGEGADGTIDRQALCLDERKAELATAIDVITTFDEGQVGRGPFMIATLTPPESCLTANAGVTAASDTPPTGSLAAEAFQLQRRAAVRTRAGQYPTAIGEAYAAFALATASGHQPTVAKAELSIGRALSAAGLFAPAEDLLASAVWRAEAAEDDATAAGAAASLIYIVGSHHKRLADGLRWARIGRSFAERVPEDVSLLAMVLEAEANMLDDVGQREEALAQMRRVLEMRETRPPTERNRLAMTLNNLGTLLMGMGGYDEARVHLERSLQIRREVLGPAHPETGMSYLNLGALAGHLGRHEESARMAERGLKIFRAAVGDVHPTVASGLQILSASRVYLGQYEQGIAESKELIEIRRKIYGDNHISVAVGLSNLGGLYANIERYDDAERTMAESLAVHEMATTDATDLAGVRHNLAIVARRRGDLEKAEGMFRHSLELWEEGQGATHPDLTFPLAGLGDVLLHRGKFEEARQHLERAVKLGATLERTPRMAQLDAWLARALWPVIEERPRAWRLAQSAAKQLATAPGEYRVDHEELEQWMQAHRSEVPATARD